MVAINLRTASHKTERNLGLTQMRDITAFIACNPLKMNSPTRFLTLR